MSLPEDWLTLTPAQLSNNYNGPDYHDILAIQQAIRSMSVSSIQRITNPDVSEGYIPTTSTNAARGTALRLAMSEASSGQTVSVPPGTYDMLTNVLTIPAGVTMLLLPGVVILTDVDGADDGAGVHPVGDGCTIIMYGAKIKVKDTVSSGFQFPVGATENAGNGAQAVFTNLSIYGGIIEGASDAFYIQHSGVCSAKLYDVTLKATFDACVAFNDAAGTPALHTVDCHNCVVEVVGPFAGTGPTSDGIVAEDGATIRWFGGRVDVRLGGTARNTAAYAEGGGVIELHNVQTYVDNGGNPKYDLENISGTIRVTGGSGTGLDGAFLSTGTITQIGSAENGLVGAPVQTTTLGVGATTLALTRNKAVITGDGGGNTLETITGAADGTDLVLQFVDTNVQITDAAGAVADTVKLSAAFTSAANKILCLTRLGGQWYETSRSTN